MTKNDMLIKIYHELESNNVGSFAAYEEYGITRQEYKHITAHRHDDFKKKRLEEICSELLIK